MGLDPASIRSNTIREQNQLASFIKKLIYHFNKMIGVNVQEVLFHSYRNTWRGYSNSSMCIGSFTEYWSTSGRSEFIISRGNDTWQ